MRKKSTIADVNAIKNNHIWVMVELLEKKEIVDAKWISKAKLNPNGTLLKHKAMLVAKGFLYQWSSQLS